MIGFLRRVAARVLRRSRPVATSKPRGSAEYWTEHLVDHAHFTSVAQSLHHFAWRNAQYPDYIELMPVDGQDGKVVVDYGCGPGNDLIGFSEFSRPARLIGIDVSATALEKAAARLALHGKNAELLHVDERANVIPLPDGSVDFVHTSGVLHHCANLDAVLKEIHRILKPGGELAVMVYNYDSLWLHLYTAWMHRIKTGMYADLPLLDAFRRTTDGPDCPIAHCYRPEEFTALVSPYGFTGGLRGVSIALSELYWMRERLDALMDPRLPDEHRDFLATLTFDERGIPHTNGRVAGINACFRFTKSGGAK